MRASTERSPSTAASCWPDACVPERCLPSWPNSSPTRKSTARSLRANSRAGASGAAAVTGCVVQGGFVLGILTGLRGQGAMATTTVAVERVVLRHLDRQLQELERIDPAAVTAIAAIVGDEREHHDRSGERAGQGGVLNRMLAACVSGATEAVIWIGMRV
jgi:hypothetical protein